MRLGKYLSSLTKPEVDELKQNCGFTKEECEMLDMVKGKRSYAEISQKMGYSTATVGRRIQELSDRVFSAEKNSIPIWEKLNLSIEEAAAYSNIGINKINEMLKEPSCPFVLYIGTGKRVIKRKEFEKYLEKKREV